MSRRNRSRARGRPAAPASPLDVQERAPAHAGGQLPAAAHAIASTSGADADEPTSEADLLHRRALEVREFRRGRALPPAGLESRSTRTTATGTITVTYPVMGMTCRSCEVRIHRHVSRLPHVQGVSASAVRGQVTVESTEPVSPAAIEAAIRKAGYEIGRTPWLERDPRVWATFAAGLALVALLAVVVSLTGLDDLAAGAGDLASGGLVVALLLGLAAGVSTCMALVGGLVLGLSASFSASRPAGTSAAAALRPGVVFVFGRIAGYTVFGAALGAIGASVAMPPQLTAVLMIVVAVVMTILGARLTGISPRVAGWSPTLPMGLGARLGLTGGDGAPTAYSDTRAATLGALSFFLPCGFTQAIQVFALSTGSPIFGAALLATFAIGTAPGLLGVAGLPMIVPARHKPTLLRL
ncbi:MAG TPA: sulfite exporter TauE/SafE family protein, partial [Candidatus Limnocylindrales bacterium]|nr:sulfite exporter TauE/SafE family protein [Candidatus Limnocylindrales bacterium]